MTTINGKPKIIKEINMALVRKNIIRNSPITKPELSKLLGLSLPTINKCVDELLEKEIVKVFEGEVEVKGSGKKPIFYEINSDHVSYIAAYFKGTVLTVREYNLLGKVKNEKVKKYPIRIIKCRIGYRLLIKYFFNLVTYIIWSSDIIVILLFLLFF